MQRIAEIAMRFFLCTVPVHRLGFVRQIGRRAINCKYEALHVATHIDTSNRVGKDVAEFSISPKSSCLLSPINPKYVAKAKAFKDNWTSRLNATSTHEAEKLRCKEKIRQFERLIWISTQKWSTMQDFERSDWEAYDEITFELTKEHLQNLGTVFATPAFKQSQKIFSEWGVDFAESMVAEVLSKSLGYSEGHHGKEIHLPIDQKMVPYIIKEFNFGKELPGFILEPVEKNAPAWIIARGTETLLKKDRGGREIRKGALESIQADFHPVSISHEAVNKALQLPLLKQVFENHKQLKLTGHSLGGALVTDLATRYPDLAKKIYTFNSPGLGRMEMEGWNDKLEEALVAFDVSGDFVPCAGLYIKGFHVEITQDPPKNPFIMHNEMVLNKSFTAGVVDNQIECKRKARKRLAAIQQFQMRVFALHQKHLSLIK